MNLKDFKNTQMKYDWKTIYLGVQENYFSKDVISDYAIELMDKGDESEFVSELAWGVSYEDLDEVMMEINGKYFPYLDNECKVFAEESRKLRYVCLQNMKAKYKEDNELLGKIATFYADHNYPEDMVSFIHYMPQDVPTTKEELLKRFDEFLNLEKLNFR